MLTVSIVLALLAAVAVALVFLIRSRKPQHMGSPPKPARDEASPPPHRLAPARPAAPGDQFDSDATQVYLRPPVETAPRQRQGSAAPVAGAHLVSLSGSHKGATFPIAATGITIGRHPSSNIVLADPRVSSHHAWIGLVAGKAVLRDLKSTNGTFLNAQTHTSVSEVELRPGDTIFFGGHQGDQFRFVAD